MPRAALRARHGLVQWAVFELEIRRDPLGANLRAAASPRSRAWSIRCTGFRGPCWRLRWGRWWGSRDC